jgi:hypothetical protein
VESPTTIDHRDFMQSGQGSAKTLAKTSSHSAMEGSLEKETMALVCLRLMTMAGNSIR